MRNDVIAAVEQLTGRTVEAFLSDNRHERDVAAAVEIFLMRRTDGTTTAPAGPRPA